jgi:hypothetical protein
MSIALFKYRFRDEFLGDEGYRRLAFMMMDTDIVSVSPSSVRRVLSDRRVAWTSGTSSPQRKEQALCSLSNHTSVGA